MGARFIGMSGFYQFSPYRSKMRSKARIFCREPIPYFIFANTPFNKKNTANERKKKFHMHMFQEFFTQNELCLLKVIKFGFKKIW